jgi:hypothetical protein
VTRCVLGANVLARVSEGGCEGEREDLVDGEIVVGYSGCRILCCPSARIYLADRKEEKVCALPTPSNNSPPYRLPRSPPPLAGMQTSPRTFQGPGRGFLVFAGLLSLFWGWGGE